MSKPIVSEAAVVTKVVSVRTDSEKMVTVRFVNGLDGRVVHEQRVAERDLFPEMHLSSEPDARWRFSHMRSEGVYDYRRARR